MDRNKIEKNNVHFYVARDKDGWLWLYMCKPYRNTNEFYACEDKGGIAISCSLEDFGLNEDDYKNLKWENEPVEVYLNLEN